MQARTAVLIAMAGCVLSACSSASSGLSTGSTALSNTAAATPAAPVSDPTSRAFQVGSIAAKATKCGYNFDPAKLKANFLAAEVGAGATPADIARITQIYDTSYNGVTKAVAGQADYCSDGKTAAIKADLTRHLAGDFTTTKPPPAPKSDGWFSDWGLEGGSSGPSFGSDNWWSKQQDALGG